MLKHILSSVLVLFLCSCTRENPKPQVPVPLEQTVPLMPPPPPVPSSRNVSSMSQFLAAPAPNTFVIQWSNAPSENADLWESGIEGEDASGKWTQIAVGAYTNCRVTVTNNNNFAKFRAFNRIKGTGPKQ